MTEIDYASRVARGIALMDEKWPNWATEIDLEKLDIKSATCCVTAQYAKTHGLGNRWWEAMEPLGLGEYDGTYEEHGFNGSVSVGGSVPDDAYDALNALWRSEIERRRARAQDAPAEPEAGA